MGNEGCDCQAQAWNGAQRVSRRLYRFRAKTGDGKWSEMFTDRDAVNRWACDRLLLGSSRVEIYGAFDWQYAVNLHRVAVFERIETEGNISERFSHWP